MLPSPGICRITGARKRPFDGWPMPVDFTELLFLTVISVAAVV